MFEMQINTRNVFACVGRAPRCLLIRIWGAIFYQYKNNAVEYCKLPRSARVKCERHSTPQVNVLLAAFIKTA